MENIFPEIEQIRGMLNMRESIFLNCLAEKIQWILTHKTEFYSIWENVKWQYREKYSSRKNYEILIDI